MASLSAAEREAFLAVPRVGILTTLRADGSPVAVPVWFEWDGAAVRLFSSVTSGKIARLERDARASLLVANSVGEPEAWVAFDGAATITRDGAFELAERLAGRYWDMQDPERQATLALWRESAAALRVVEITPRRVRSSKG
jgi:PPOX class probable F420-dependent enzyme